MYIRLGAGPLKNKTALSPHNLFLKAALFWKYRLGSNVRIGFHHVLLRMIRSGGFYPAAGFILPARAPLCSKLMQCESCV